MIYFYLYTYLFILGLVDLNLSDRKIKTILLSVTTVVFIFVSGMRWETGTDWESYLTYFKYYNSYSDFFSNNEFEVGYSFLNFSIKTLTSKYTYLLLALAVLSILPKAISFSRFPYFLIIFFGYFGVFEADMFAVRQAVAVGFALLSFVSIVNRKLLWFICCILVGTLFHWTILGFIPAYFIYNLSNFQKKNIAIVAIIVACYIIRLHDFIFKFSLNYFVGIDAEGPIGQKLQFYSQISDSTDKLSMLGLLSRLLMIIYFIYLTTKYKNDKLLNGFTNLYVFGFFIYVILGSAFIVFVRLSWYYSFTEIFLIAYSLKFYKSTYDRLLIYFVFSLYFGLRIAQNISAQSHLKQPFYFFWDESERKNFSSPF